MQIVPRIPPVIRKCIKCGATIVSMNPGDVLDMDDIVCKKCRSGERPEPPSSDTPGGAVRSLLRILSSF